MLDLEKVKAFVLGHAVADALGVAVEFQSREKLRREPVVGMRGYGSHEVPAGSWSDDTSMTLATMDSIASLGKIDYLDIMQRFQAWVHEAAYTPGGKVFDIGRTTLAAIRKFCNGIEPVFCGGSCEFDNGNGSLMRMAPMAMWLYHLDGIQPSRENMEIMHNTASITHRHLRSKIGCGIYVFIALRLLAGEDLHTAVYQGVRGAESFYGSLAEYKDEMQAYGRIWAIESLAGIAEEEIKSSGYVVDTLEASLWCLLTTENYAACVLQAVNLGEDTDTVGAVAGGLAGLAYGLDGIPKEWLEVLLRRDYLEELCGKFMASLPA